MTTTKTITKTTTPRARATAGSAVADAADIGAGIEAAPEVGGAVADEASGGDEAFKKRDLIDSVTAATGMKRRDVKVLTDAVLAEMGRVLGEGRSLNLEPLGKLRVARTAQNGANRVLTCKLRQRGVAADDA